MIQDNFNLSYHRIMYIIHDNHYQSFDDPLILPLSPSTDICSETLQAELSFKI